VSGSSVRLAMTLGAPGATAGGAAESAGAMQASEVAGDATAIASVSSAGGGAAAAAGQAPATSKAARGFVYFSDRLKAASGHATRIVFHPAVRAAMEPELSKVREGRVLARALSYPAAIERSLRSAAFHSLCEERVHTYETARFPLALAFGRLLEPAGWDSSLPLDEIHKRFHSDRGAKGARMEKAAMLRPLTDEASRAELLKLYEALVLELIAPWVASIIGCDRMLFQAIPCVRVHRPGEFSIGPHIDAQYQLPDGSLNAYLPLTSIDDTNSLYLESAPGREDFHPLRLAYGQFCTFYGAFCTHFAVENLSERTRVSLDFRVVPGGCYAAHIDEQPPDFRVGGYYSEAVRAQGAAGDSGQAEGAFCVSARGRPYWRHGFPHTAN
jgi:hypothetical protein